MKLTIYSTIVLCYQLVNNFMKLLFFPIITIPESEKNSSIIKMSKILIFYELSHEL